MRKIRSRIINPTVVPPTLLNNAGAHVLSHGFFRSSPARDSEPSHSRCLQQAFPVTRPQCNDDDNLSEPLRGDAPHCRPSHPTRRLVGSLVVVVAAISSASLRRRHTGKPGNHQPLQTVSRSLVETSERQSERRLHVLLQSRSERFDERSEESADEKCERHERANRTQTRRHGSPDPRRCRRNDNSPFFRLLHDASATQ